MSIKIIDKCKVTNQHSQEIHKMSVQGIVYVQNV